MKKIISVIILFAVLTSFAQVKFGMQMRLRSELQNLNSTDADKQIYDRRVDFRFRPDIEYAINDYLCVKAVFEIGDIQYGTAPSADLGTDGINLETKNVYMDAKPTKNHLFRIGLIPYKDAHSMIVDADLAGIMWQGNFDKYSVELAWFAASDNDEEFIVNDTYSFGTTLLALNQSYRLNKNIMFGIYNLFVFNRSDEYMQGVNYDEVSMFLAPRFVGEFGKFFVDAQLSINNIFADYDNVGNNPEFTQIYYEEGNGIGLSVKSKFEMDEKTTFRANMLFRGCYEGLHNYQDYNSFYDTGLEIVNENANGISTHNPMISQFGVVVPSIFADWKYKDNITFTGGFGFIMNDQNYGKRIDLLKTINDDMFMAWELDLKAKVVLYEKLQFFPYFAIFVPSEGYAYDTQTLDEDGEPATDMQMKIGTAVKYNF
ncbi:MAG: hypothetical protein KKD38_09250 [Candidatus Delongbacteria bacterium]|nr:hypothetical protein [Candidatus Delongbacteria bacterium]